MNNIDEAILELVSDDQYGIWEISWYIRGKMNISSESAINLCAKSLRYLYENKYISFLIDGKKFSYAENEKCNFDFTTLDDLSIWGEPINNDRLHFVMLRNSNN